MPIKPITKYSQTLPTLVGEQLSPKITTEGRAAIVQYYALTQHLIDNDLLTTALQRNRDLQLHLLGALSACI